MALDQDPEHLNSLILNGKILIEHKKYKEASEYFKKAISLNRGNPNLILWDAYANFLNAETSGLDEKKYNEELNNIIRDLERVTTITERKNTEITPYIYYFLGCFYMKSKDILTAKEKFEKCTKSKPKTQIQNIAKAILNHIWD